MIFHYFTMDGAQHTERLTVSPEEAAYIADVVEGERTMFQLMQECAPSHPRTIQLFVQHLYDVCDIFGEYATEWSYELSDTVEYTTPKEARRVDRRRSARRYADHADRRQNTLSKRQHRRFDVYE